MKLLITGASGFLGSALALNFLREGHRVALLLRKTSQLDRLDGRHVEFDLGHCESYEEIEVFITRTDPDVIIHTACAYGRRGETVAAITDANLRYGLLILQAAQRAKKPITFINAGTKLKADVSHYALSKHQFSQWGRFFASDGQGQLRFINVLLQHIYGPGDDPTKFTTHVIHACHRNEPALKLTAGEQKRDFIYIDDVVSAYSTLVNNCAILSNVVDIEVGSGLASPIREFVLTVHKLTKSQTQLQFGALPYRSNEPMELQADISQIIKLGWQPKFDIEHGIRKIVEVEFEK